MPIPPRPAHKPNRTVKMESVRPLAVPLDPNARIGRVLRERWRVDELVWTTPASSLYWATHRTGTRAAIRVLAPELSASDSRAGMFLETASIVQRIAHDGAVRILDDDRDQDGCVFLVLELFDAVSLRALMEAARDPMSPEEAARIGVGILEVLAAAHRAGIQHGALRAEDVFVTRQGHVKLLGFEGRAPSADPEAGPNFQRDTSATGTLLYTMLAATPPRGHSLAIARPDLPTWLVSAVDRALGFGAAAPWPDAGAMLAAILSAYKVPTPLDAFEPHPVGPDAPAPIVPSVEFPVTNDMNPLFVQTRGAARPMITVTGANRAARAVSLRSAEAERRRRRTWVLGVLAVGFVLSLLLVLFMRQP